MRRIVFALIVAVGCSSEAKKEDKAPPEKPASTAPAYNKPEAPPAPKYTETPSGLKYQDEVAGTGKEAHAGDTVTVHYRGTFEDGSEFDSSRKHGQPFEFKLGMGSVIKGWDEGVQGMRVGGKRHLIIPPQLGYGEQGYPGAIPPNATLLFDVELLGVR